MRIEHDMPPIPLLELQHADPAVGAGAREQTPGFVGRPGDDVHGGGVVREVGDPGPAAGGLVAPDEDAGVVGGGREDVAVFGVGLGGRGVRDIRGGREWSSEDFRGGVGGTYP